MEMRSAISVVNLTKRFADLTVIDDLSLKVERGFITSVLAPSGAGKTTLLRIISGLSKPTSGMVLVNGNAVLGPSPDIGFMFQENSAFPWLTVRENVEYGCRLKANRSLRHWREDGDEVRRLCRELGLERFLDYYPSQLSGGQKQRVVIARSLILQPKIILCDEPFSALDEVTRNELRNLLILLHRRYSPTVMFITHSVEEALFLGDRLIVCTGPPLKPLVDRAVSFGEPRRVDLLYSAEFARLRKEVKTILEDTRNDTGEK
jgi:NitT/TauT family transport system ATP-binding protein